MLQYNVIWFSNNYYQQNCVSINGMPNKTFKYMSGWIYCKYQIIIKYCVIKFCLSDQRLVSTAEANKRSQQR